MSRQGSPKKGDDTELFNEPRGRIGEDTGLEQLSNPSPRRSSSQHVPSEKQGADRDTNPKDNDSPTEVPWMLPSEERADEAPEKEGGDTKSKAKTTSERNAEEPSAVSESEIPNQGTGDEERPPGAYSVQPGAGAERQDPGFISPQEQETTSPENVNQHSTDEVTEMMPVAAEVVTDDRQDFRDEVRRIMTEEAVHAEAVVPIHQEEDIESGIIKEKETMNEESRPFYKKRWVLGSLLVLVVVGIAVGVAVPLATKTSDDTSAQSNVGVTSPPSPTPSPTIPSPPSTSAPTAFPGCDVNPNNSVCFTVQTELREKGVHGENLITASTDAVGSQTDCLIFCQESFAARYASNVNGDSCVCYDSVDCLIPWGDQVDPSTIAVGTVFTKENVNTCTFDFCDANPDHWFCFTNQKAELREKQVYGVNLTTTATTDAASRNDCLEFCQESFAARYASNVNGDSCVCYDSVDCLVPWGDQVDPSTIAVGTVFTKEIVNTCTFDYCEANPDHWFCFTNQKTELRENNVYGENLNVTATTDAGSRNDCLEFCQESFAARYASNLANGDSCACYDSVDCLVPWGDQVDPSTIADGTVFTKEIVNTCTFDFCDTNPDHWYCFTDQKTELRDNNVYGENLNVTATTDAGSRNDCLEFCQESFAARYASNVNGDSCVCYDSVDCLIPWGDQVDKFSIADGTVYTKEEINTCTFDFCTINPADSLCV